MYIFIYIYIYICYPYTCTHTHYVCHEETNHADLTYAHTCMLRAKVHTYIHAYIGYRSYMHACVTHTHTC